MKRKRVVQGLVGLVFIVVMLAVPLAVLADAIAMDADTPISRGWTPLDLGEVCANSTVTGTALLAIERTSGGVAYADGAVVTVRVLSRSGAVQSATIGEPNTITLPSNWVGRDYGTVSTGYVTSTVTLVTGAPGSVSGAVSYSANVGGTTGVTGRMGVSAVVIECPPSVIEPIVSITTPADGAVYLRGQVVYADYACSVEEDAPALDTCLGTVPQGDPIDTSSVREHTFVVTATDVADTAASKTHTYSVIDPAGYLFDGFLRPIDNEGWNVARAGAAIPMRFSLGGYWGMDVVKSVSYASAECAVGADSNVVGDEALNPGQSSLSYDAESDQYNYVWKTQRDWAGTCRVFDLTLNDGTTHTAKFAFR